MERRVPCVLHVLFARLLACVINLRACVRVACKYTCEDVKLLQVCTVNSVNLALEYTPIPNAS